MNRLWNGNSCFLSSTSTKYIVVEGEYWTEDEIERLREMFDEHFGITEAAVTLKRSETAIYQQMEKQDLFDRKANPKRRKHSERLPQCFRPICMNVLLAARTLTNVWDILTIRRTVNARTI